MEIIRVPKIAQDTCKKYRMRGRSIGFVPTMGALHEGHLSLIRRAKDENDISVVSLFVNPAQFGPSEDFLKYPRSQEEDIKKLRAAGVDLLFLPEDSQVYSEGHSTFIDVEALSEKLCGKFRPGHFRGVATVVAKFFNIVNPTHSYFGQKDYQQSVIIRKMVKDLGFDVDVIVCPTVREHDGLAVSSRNQYLNEKQRGAASVVYRCLVEASDRIKSGVTDSATIKELMAGILSQEESISSIDYASVFDKETFDELLEIKSEVLLAVAVKMVDTRLIDNMLTEP
jgi:pantoate--beta-alanine ligase